MKMNNIRWILVFFLMSIIFVQAEPEVITPSVNGFEKGDFEMEEAKVSETIIYDGKAIEEIEGKSAEEIGSLPETTVQETIKTEEEITPVKEQIPLEPLLPPRKDKNSGPVYEQALIEVGENWERSCANEICTDTIYVHQKYYQEDGTWQQIDENFYSSGCQSNYNFCVTNNLYQVHMKTNTNAANAMRFIRNGKTFTFVPVALKYSYQQNKQELNNIQASAAQVTNSKVSYPNSFKNGIDLQFHYFPRMFKEELIIESNTTLPPTNLTSNTEEVTLDLESTFSIDQNMKVIINGQEWGKTQPATTQEAIQVTNENTSFYLAPPIAYDNLFRAIRLTYVIENRGNGFYLTVQVPYDWLQEVASHYPITIDPTITLDNNSIAWDGNVNYNDGVTCPSPPHVCNNPSRIGNYPNLHAGTDSNFPSTGYTHYRADIDWDLSAIPDNAEIEEVNLTLYVAVLGLKNEVLFFHHMLGNSSTYANTDAGNGVFYEDIGDGTEYLNQLAVVSTRNNFVLSENAQFLSDFQAVLNGSNSWSIGITSNESGGDGPTQTKFASKNAEIANNRPTLTITYTPFANETQGDAAIEQGILNILGNGTTIYNETQVYTRNKTNAQQLGRFDKFTMNGSKRWAINYITPGENFTRMYNLSDTVFVLEMQDLYESEITSEVEAFISGTA